MELRTGKLASSAVPILTPPQESEFRRCCTAIFRKWTALQLAIENEWGGPASKDKADTLLANILEWLLQNGAKERYEDDLEDALEDSMSDDFKTQLEDGSARDVAREVFRARNACASDNAAEIERIAGKPGAAAAAGNAAAGGSVRQRSDGKVVPKGIGVDDDSDDDDDDDDDSDDDSAGNHDAQPPPPRHNQPRNNQPDDDGWVTVTRKR